MKITFDKLKDKGKYELNVNPLDTTEENNLRFSINSPHTSLLIPILYLILVSFSAFHLHTQFQAQAPRQAPALRMGERLVVCSHCNVRHETHKLFIYYCKQ